MTACVWLSACALSYAYAAAITGLSPQRGGVALSAGFILYLGKGKNCLDLLCMYLYFDPGFWDKQGWMEKLIEEWTSF